MKYRFLLLLTAGWLRAFSLFGQDYPVVPVPFTSVRLQPGFWATRLETNRTVTLPFGFKKCEETGRIDNFAVAGGLKPGTFRGLRYDDSDVFKVMEGAAYSLQTHPDPKLERYLDSLVTLVAAAQEPDGYLYTIRTILKDSTGLRDWTAGPTRYSFENGSHELYNVGHMYEAAVAHYQATGRRQFLDVALKNANHLVNTIGPGKLIVVPGHQETEIGLVKLYRVTQDKRYLDLARFLVDMRGRGDKRPLFLDDAGLGPAYFQDHKPLVGQTEAVGHAVRAGYLYAGATDLAAIAPNADYRAALDRIWTDVVTRKQYLTGGLGARGRGEAFGPAFELPNESAYAETCAAVANLLWNHRLFLLTGDARYMDVFERVLYNGFLAGVSLSGDRFYYVNRLQSDGKNNEGWSVERSPWFGTSCCPTNVVRFMPSLPGYVYASRGSALYVNLFMPNEADVVAAGQPVRIRQQTNYPWDGAVTLTVSPRKPQAFALLLRVPGWALGRPMPGELYRYVNNIGAAPTLRINGKPVDYVLENGYARVSRTWRPGDRVAFSVEMPVRYVVADARVKDNAGKVAVERGPLVYCAEGADNNGRVLGTTLSPTTLLTPGHRPDLLGGITTLTATTLAGQPLVLIPYYAWANRGANEMTVWFNQATP